MALSRWTLLVVVGCLLLVSSLPSSVSGAEVIEPPDVPYEPEMRPLLLFAAGGEELLPGLSGNPGQSQHLFQLGALSQPSDGPFLQTDAFGFDTPIGSEEWNFTLWTRGSGSVDFEVKIHLNGNELDAVNSGGVALTSEAQSVTVNGFNLPEGVVAGDTLGIRWTVSCNSLTGSCDCSVLWGEEDYPTNLSMQAATYQFDDPWIIDEGQMYRGSHENYSRQNIVWGVQARWALGELGIDQDSIVLHADDGGVERILEPYGKQTASEYGIYTWEIEEWNDGVNLAGHVMWNDTAGNSAKTTQVHFVMDDRGPALLGAGSMNLLYALTVPVLLAIAVWLRGRYRELVSKAEERGHGPSMKGDLERMLLVCAFLIIGSNNALVIYAFHTRELGATEDLVVLHVGLIALTYGICGTLWGAAADRFGQRRKMWMVALTGSALLAIAFPFLPQTAWMAASVVQMGLLSSARVAFAVGTEWYPEQKGEIIGLLYAVASIFSAIAGIFSGWLYNQMLDSGTMWAMGAVTAIAAPMLLVAAWLVMRFQGEEFDWPTWMIQGGEPPAARVKTSLKEKFAVIRDLFKFESKWPLLVLFAVLLVSIPRGTVIQTSLRYFEVRGADVDLSTLLEAWAVLAVLILYAVIGRVCDRLGAERVLLWSALTYGALWSLFSVGLPLMLAVLIFVVPIYPMLLVSNDALLARFTHAKERNRGVGMAGGVALAGQGIGLFIGFYLMRWLLDSGMLAIDAYHWIYRASVLPWILAVAATWWLFKSINREGAGDADGGVSKADGNSGDGEVLQAELAAG